MSSLWGHSIFLFRVQVGPSSSDTGSSWSRQSTGSRGDRRGRAGASGPCSPPRGGPAWRSPSRSHRLVQQSPRGTQVSLAPRPSSGDRSLTAELVSPEPGGEGQSG